MEDEAKLAATAEASVRRRVAVREQIEANPKKTKSKRFEPKVDTADIVESAPVSLSDTIKQTLYTGSTAKQSTPRTSVLDPPKEPVVPAGVATATTYNPETERTSTVVKPAETVKDDIVSFAPAAPAAPAMPTTPAAPVTPVAPVNSITVSNPRETVPVAPITSVLPDVPMIQEYKYVYDPLTKTRTKQLVSKPATLSAAQEQQIQQAVKDRLPKLSSESKEQYETRVAKVIAQDKDFALKGIPVADRQKAIADEAAKHVAEQSKYTMTEQQRQETVQAMKEREELVAKLGLDPNRKYTGSYLAEIEKRQNDPFKPVLEGLTTIADTVLSEVVPLAGPLGGIMAQAYKAFAPPTSKYYQESNFDDKIVNFLASNVQDKAQDLLMGQLKNVAGFAKSAAQGYRRVDLEGGGLTGAVTGSSALQNAGSKIFGGNQYSDAAGNIRAASNIGVKAELPTAKVGPLAPSTAPQAPQRLVAPRTDVLISPRAVRGPIARPVRGVARPMARM